MAYTVSIFRENAPITADELLAVDGAEKFTFPGITNPKTGMTLSMGNNDMFSYNGAVFTLRKGRLEAECRHEDTPDILRPLAEALGAVIQGEEGEYY